MNTISGKAALPAPAAAASAGAQSNASNSVVPNIAPACLGDLMNKILSKEKKACRAHSDPVALKTRLTTSLFVSGVDLEEVSAILKSSENHAKAAAAAAEEAKSARGSSRGRRRSGKERSARYASTLAPAALATGESNSGISSAPSLWKELVFDSKGQEINEARLEKERLEKLKEKRVLPQIILTGKTSRPKVHLSRGTDVDSTVTHETVHMSIDANNYYGADARRKLFQKYKLMSHQRNAFSGTESSVMASAPELLEETFQLHDKVLEDIRSHVKMSGSSKSDVSGKSKAALKPKPRVDPILTTFDAFDEIDHEMLTQYPVNYFSYGGLHKLPPIAAASGGDSLAASSLTDSLKDFSLSNRQYTLPDEGTTISSPRTRFLGGCIRENLFPLPRLVCRGKLTENSINLAHYGIGDKMGQVLAECLNDLPNVETINLADNDLTDKSLPFILNSLHAMPRLSELNMSRNKFDDDASAALADYVSSSTSSVSRLIMQHADVDDFECAKFVECLMTNENLRELDLSNNLLGSAEILNSVFGEITTGGEAIANYLASAECKLTSLKLAWNSIRLASAIEMTKAVAANHTLTFLDLSYNGLGNEAGVLMGESIQINKCLRTLMLKNNNLGPVSCFSICVGVIDNLCLRRLALDENPIGEEGARAVMQVPVTIGSRVELTATNCNTKFRTTDFTFDQDNPTGRFVLDLSNPFKRACAMSLMQIVATHRTLIFSECSYEWRGKSKKMSLASAIARDIELYFDDHQKATIAGLRYLHKAASNTELGLQLFREADEDGSGELDKTELAHILDKMGFSNLDPERMEDFMAVFDIDGAGSIEQEEFLSLLRSQSKEAAHRITEMTEYPIIVQSSSPTVKYNPPKMGTLRMTIIDGFARKEIHKIISSMDHKYAMDMAMNMGNASHVQAAIKHSKI